MMPASKYPGICFAILSATMLLAGLGTFGAFLLLYFYYPSGVFTTIVLAVNGLLCWFLAVLCALSAWRLLKHTPKARPFAKVTCALVACFTLWTLLFDGANGWSVGGVSEVITWSILEALIANYLIRVRHEAAT
jgi:hypothetical protein